MSGNINCKSIILDENINHPTLPLHQTNTDNFILFSDVADECVKLKFSNNRSVILSEGKNRLTCQESMYILPVKDLTSPFYLLGNNKTIKSNITGNDLVQRLMNGNKLCINVVQLTGIGSVNITGTIVNLQNSIIQELTESITIDDTTTYLSTNKWLQITSIVFSPEITNIVYNIGAINVYNKMNASIEIVGIDVDVCPKKNKIPSIQVQLTNVCNLPNNKCLFKSIENIAADSSGIVDHIRTDAVVNRGCNIGTTSESNYILSYRDYYEYFQNDENCIKSRDNESDGLIIKLSWTNVTSINLNLIYRTI